MPRCCTRTPGALGGDTAWLPVGRRRLHARRRHSRSLKWRGPAGRLRGPGHAIQEADLASHRRGPQRPLDDRRIARRWRAHRCERRGRRPQRTARSTGRTGVESESGVDGIRAGRGISGLVVRIRRRRSWHAGQQPDTARALHRARGQRALGRSDRLPRAPKRACVRRDVVDGVQLLG